MRAEGAPSLSLLSRCAFVTTKAQRARVEPAWRVGDAEINLQNDGFVRAARCAIVATNAQRAT